MLDSEDCTLSLESLFYERPVVLQAVVFCGVFIPNIYRKCQEQITWQSEPLLLSSEIPETQHLKGTAESLSCGVKLPMTDHLGCLAGKGLQPLKKVYTIQLKKQVCLPLVCLRKLCHILNEFIFKTTTYFTKGKMLKHKSLDMTCKAAQFRSVFKEFPYFNYVQSKALDDILYTSKNFVACAPTGSGKTVLFELAIIRLLMEVPAPWHSVKVVYMAPIKALCSQCYENWRQKFGSLGLNCKELTGDTEIDDFFEVQDAHVIMTTPEKWDSMTRKWRLSSPVQLVKLFLIDEIHVVKDSTRGATLEVVVSRMKTMNAYRDGGDHQSRLPMRFVAVSATIPNIADVSRCSDGRADGRGNCLGVIF
uniref:Helicase for meiosis 1 n=1 Tax=Paramormyrops kingsleyae TaxID=1676925 RepID=A0A3B3RIS3_9TELE